LPEKGRDRSRRTRKISRGEMTITSSRETNERRIMCTRGVKRIKAREGERVFERPKTETGIGVGVG